MRSQNNHRSLVAALENDMIIRLLYDSGGLLSHLRFDKCKLGWHGPRETVKQDQHDVVLMAVGNQRLEGWFVVVGQPAFDEHSGLGAIKFGALGGLGFLGPLVRWCLER